MRAKDFRALARDTLRGKWGPAVAVCLVAGLIVGVPSLIVNFSSASMLEVVEELEMERLLTALTRLAAVSWIASIVSWVLSGALNFGIADYFTRLVKGEPVAFKQLFAHFGRIGKGMGMTFMITLFSVLWSMLFVLPGSLLVALLILLGVESMLLVVLVMMACIIPCAFVVFRYAMVPYLLAEFTDLGVMDAIRESKRLMRGNCWRYFCLIMSFIGWYLLALVTFGLSYLWVNPYMQTANAAFYMDVTGRGPSSEPEQPARPDYLNSPEF